MRSGLGKHAASLCLVNTLYDLKSFLLRVRKVVKNSLPEGTAADELAAPVLDKSNVE